MVRHDIDQKKIFANPISVKRFLSKLYKGSDHQNTTQVKKKMRKDLNRYFRHTQNKLKKHISIVKD